MPFTGLAPFKIMSTIGPTRFCHGTCQKELDIKEFPKKPARHCKKCHSDLIKQKYHSKKAERQFF